MAKRPIKPDDMIALEAKLAALKIEEQKLNELAAALRDKLEHIAVIGASRVAVDTLARFGVKKPPRRLRKAKKGNDDG